MNSVNTLVSFFLARVSALRGWVMNLTRKQQGALALGVILLAVLVSRLGGDVVPEAAAEQSDRKVTLALVGDLTQNINTLPLVGVVESTNEAVIRSETSGQLTRVYRKLGDRVSAGQTIAEFDNAAERAAVLQAEGAYDAAKAGRALAGGNSAIVGVNSGTSASALRDVKSSTLNTIASAYLSLDDVVRSKTDSVYNNPQSTQPSLIMFIPDTSLKTRLENTRVSLEALLKARDERNKTLTVDSDLKTELVTVQNEIETVKSYLSELSRAYSIAVSGPTYSQASIDAQKAVVSVARSTVSGSLSSVIAAQTALTASIAAQEVAGQSVTNTGPSIASADASVKSALGAYRAALARLDATIIRSPISGTLNSLSIETGDFVGQSTQVAVVSNNGTLEIVSYISEEDAVRVAVNTPVRINVDGKGIVRRVASALDPLTKKIEIRIGILGDKSEYINGESVSLTLGNDTKVTAKVLKNTPIKIPLSALKITPQGSFVFTVSTSSIATAVPVTMGQLLGEDVRITSGLTKDMLIIRDVRGLKDGMKVDAR